METMNDQDNENHPDNKNESNYPADKYMFKVNYRKKVLASLWLALNINMLFSTKDIKDLCFTCIENVHIFLPSLLKNVCFTLH